MFTDNIWDDNAWSDPVYFDNPGFDQDVSSLPLDGAHQVLSYLPSSILV